MAEEKDMRAGVGEVACAATEKSASVVAGAPAEESAAPTEKPVQVADATPASAAAEKPSGSGDAEGGAADGAAAPCTGAAPAFPVEREGIERVLPHRDPFVWVSRVTACEFGVHAEAELDVDAELPLFKGHFPGHPVLPGVILMEALAQTACYCVLGGSGAEGRLGFFAGIDKAKFRRQVQPGDTVRLVVDIVKNGRRMAVADCRAYVGEVLAAEARQTYVLGE